MMPPFVAQVPDCLLPQCILGLLNQQIAFTLGVWEATIMAHVSAILHKFDVESRTQALIAASRIDGDLTALAPS